MQKRTFISIDSEDAGDAASKEFNGHGEQDDTKEFAQHIDHVRTQFVGDLVEVADDKIVEYDIQEKTDEDVHRGILSPQGYEGSDGTRSSDEGERYRHHASATGCGLVLYYLATQHHLEGEDEEHQSAGDSEGSRVDTEEVEECIAHEIERHEEDKSHEGSLERLDGLALIAHRDEDRNGACDVDDGEHNKEGAEDLYDINLLKHSQF